MSGKKTAFGIAAAAILILAGMTCFQLYGGKNKEYRVVCLGDSIIGNVRDESSVTTVMESMLKEPVANIAMGGTCMARSNTQFRGTYYEDSVNLCELAEAIACGDLNVQLYDIASNNFKLDYFEDVLRQLKQIDFNKTEILFIEHGINDYSAGRPLDNPEDPYDTFTYGGALRYSIEKLKNAYPAMNIVLVTPLYCYFQDNGRITGDSETSDFGYGILENYVELELQIAEEYGLEVIDNFHDLGINRTNIDEYAEDGIHLNEKGRALLAKVLAEFAGMYK